MKNTVIIIPTRLAARRFPNKPLAKINNTPMILHVLNKAKESKVGKVFVATPDKKIFDIVNNNGGIAILTQDNHPSGSDRVYEVFSKTLQNNVDLIINLQADMPNINPNTISKLEKHMKNNDCDIGTLASPIKDYNEVDVAVGLILEGVSYMKGAGMSETELIDHIKAHYNSFEIDDDGNYIETEPTETEK